MKDIKVGHAAKTWVASLSSIAGSAAMLLADDTISSGDILAVAILVLGALGVYATPNSKPEDK